MADTALMTVEFVNGPPSLEEAAVQLGIGVDAIDPHFGVVAIDPVAGIYRVKWMRASCRLPSSGTRGTVGRLPILASSHSARLRGPQIPLRSGGETFASSAWRRANT